MRLFDSHCHLNDTEDFPDLEEVLARAKEAGVCRFMLIGYDKESSYRAVELCHKYEGLYCAIGFHPCDVDKADKDFEETMKLIGDPKVKAIGEIGLDYHWEKDPVQRQKQKEYFIRQIEIANENNLPISIHERDAFNDCFEIIKTHTPKCGGVYHCYSGPADKIKEITKLGLYIGFGGTVTFKNGRRPKENAAVISPDRILLETDCPYLTPHPYRGQRNEPSYIPLVLKEISDIKDIDVDELAEITYNNTCKLFHVE